jgi:hypothetical protein
MAIMSAIAKAARAEGELVYAYQQGDADFNYKDIGPWGAVRNGYCAALGFKWIMLRLRGEDLPFDLTTRFAPKEDWRITRLHNLTKMEGYDPVLMELGLKRGVPRKFLGIPSALQIVPVTASAKGCYMLQYKRPGGGHLAGIQNEGATFRYFDANYGEFIFRGEDRFKTWYGGFLDTVGYRKRYTEAVIVTSVAWATTGGVSALRQRFGG